MAVKMIIHINRFFPSINVYSYEEFLYRLVSPESRGGEDQDEVFCRCCFSSYMPHNTGSFLGGEERERFKEFASWLWRFHWVQLEVQKPHVFTHTFQGPSRVLHQQGNSKVRLLFLTPSGDSTFQFALLQGYIKLKNISIPAQSGSSPSFSSYLRVD